MLERMSALLQSFLNRVSSLDHKCSKAIQQSFPSHPLMCRLKVTEGLEHTLAVPALLFGRHCVPFLILFSFIFLRFHYACYYGLSWFLKHSLLMCSLLTVMVSEVLKNIFCRPRPRKQSVAERSIPIRDDVSNPAFPSGDSAQAAVAAACAYRLFRCDLILLFPIPTMFSRVYYGAHWIGDTIGGYFIGLLVTLFVTPAIFHVVELYLGPYLPSALFL